MQDIWWSRHLANRHNFKMDSIDVTTLHSLILVVDNATSKLAIPTYVWSARSFQNTNMIYVDCNLTCASKACFRIAFSSYYPPPSTSPRSFSACTLSNFSTPFPTSQKSVTLASIGFHWSIEMSVKWDVPAWPTKPIQNHAEYKTGTIGIIYKKGRMYILLHNPKLNSWCRVPEHLMVSLFHVSVWVCVYVPELTW